MDTAIAVSPCRPPEATGPCPCCRAVTAELALVRAELLALRAEVAQMAGALAAAFSRAARQAQEDDAPPAEQYVSLDQMAALVSRHKRSLEYYRTRGLPPPAIRGRRGQAALWRWADVRGWLEAMFGRVLPKNYPGLAG